MHIFYVLPAPAIGAAFAESMECKTLARSDWLDCGEHQRRHFRKLHAVVGLTTVEECRARDQPECATLRAFPNTSKESTSTSQRSNFNTRQWFDWLSLCEYERTVIGDVRGTKSTLPSLEDGTGMPNHRAWNRIRLEQTHLWRVIALMVLLRMEAALEPC